MNTDHLQSSWDNTSVSFTGYDNDHPELPRNCHTTLDRLARRYRQFAIASVCMILVIPLWATVRTSPIPDRYRPWFLLIFISYFLTAGLMDLWLYNRIHSLDIFNAPVKRIVSESVKCRRYHLRFMMILIPFAIGAVSLLTVAVHDDVFILTGMACGGAIGLIIGTVQFLRFMRDYRLLSQELTDNQ